MLIINGSSQNKLQFRQFDFTNFSIIFMQKTLNSIIQLLLVQIKYETQKIAK